MAMTVKIEPRDSVLTIENASPARIIYETDLLKGLGYYVVSHETFMTHTATGDVEVSHIYYRKVDAV